MFRLLSQTRASDELRPFLQTLTDVYSCYDKTIDLCVGKKSAMAKSAGVEECGERLKRILDSPSVPRANHQLLLHLSRHLARVGQRNPAGPRLLGQAFAEVVFRLCPLSADVNPEHHVRILEALIATGGLVEMQAAPVFLIGGKYSKLRQIERMNPGYQWIRNVFGMQMLKYSRHFTSSNFSEHSRHFIDVLSAGASRF
ncbi:putative phosphatidylinositol 3-kinase regulatory subunit alpha-like [Scophthalmus maximus]|uniref:Putative phosphatidylinositol 3-kinase regulatory subunit alpha-like n=1 Tax=Scophthalmus maximus TaxID=52904 RepID=A0A2U9C5V4_SCOMX|nr:putative phosphatidylinositol 3-kinase regulatory subunit alpha-like [Scophthalmus maximus]